jgi:hypothetical protein
MTRTSGKDAIDIPAIVRATVRQILSELQAQAAKGYLDVVGASTYLDLSPRTFEAQVASHIAFYRLNNRGKRFYRKSDLDRFADLYRQSPRAADPGAIVDDVLAKILPGRRSA